MDYDQRQRQNARLDAADARQGTLDYQAQVERDRVRARQDAADEDAALQEDARGLAAQAQGWTDAGVMPSAEQQAGWIRAMKANQAARRQRLVERGAPDHGAFEKQHADDAAAVNAGTATPEQFVRYTTQGTGKSVANFVRPSGDQPSPVEANGLKIIQGFDNGDQDAILEGVNQALDHRIKINNGKPTPYGTQVDARVINAIPDPNDPKGSVIPTLRIWVDSGRKVDSGDEARVRANLPPDAPPGATGYYDAPLTENRSSDPKDKVKSLRIKDVTEYIGHQMELAKQINESPEAMGLIRQYQEQGGPDPQEFLRLTAQAGVQPRKLTTTRTPIPAGGSLLEETVDARGNKVSSNVIKGEDRPDNTPYGQVRRMMADEGLSFEEALQVAQQRGITKAPTKFSNGLGGGAGGGGDDATSGLSAAQKRSYDVKQKSLDSQEAAIDRRVAQENDDYRTEFGALKDGPDDLGAQKSANAAKRATLKADHQATLKRFDGERADLAANRDRLQQMLDLPGDAKAGVKATAAAADTKKAPTVGKGKLSAAQAAQRFGF